jgi:hypothetical protein
MAIVRPSGLHTPKSIWLMESLERGDRAKLNVQNAELWNAVSTMLVMPLVATFGSALGNQSANRSFLKLATQINHCG